MATMTAGPDAAAADGETVRLGPLALDLRDGGLRLLFDGVEVVRQVDCPIRDADWRTLAVAEISVDREIAGNRARLDRRFRSLDGSIDGRLTIAADAATTSATVVIDLSLTALRDTPVNRAGLVLLHPAGVAGNPLAVRHADGTEEATRFPALISPGQPVFGIAVLRHDVAGIAVDIAMTGDTFEMEDQRNWTDASFKTYCRPLSRPRPYRLDAGDTVRQSLRITLASTGSPSVATAAATGVMAQMPAILLAHEATLADRPAPAGLAELGIDGLLLRVDARRPDLARPIDAPITLEIVADAAEDIAAVAAACAAAGVRPRRVVALPRAYLSSHQPEGPWPTPRPIDLVAAVRAAFPDAEAGGGMLTNFTEFNRCRPDPAAVDFVTHGTSAIVHAADDRSVRETLEALPAVFASGRALAGDRPLHLGLVAIAMRSNPYGSATAPNPDRQRLPMATDDPRQRGRFAGAFAIGAVAEAARAGVASLAPAMTAGPIATGAGDEHWPLHQAVAALASLAGESVRIDGGPGGLLVIRGVDRTLAANLGAVPARFADADLPSMDFTIAGPRR